VFKCSDTNIVFQTAILLILVTRNNKRSSGNDGKTSDCLSGICLYYRYLELRFYFLLVNVLWIVGTCNWCLFRWFSRGKSAVCTKQHMKLLKKVRYILLVLSAWYDSFSIFILKHTKTIENINMWKWTEAGARAVKKRSSGVGVTLMKTKISWAGAGSIFTKRRSSEPKLRHFYDGFTAPMLSGVFNIRGSERDTCPGPSSFQELPSRRLRVIFPHFWWKTYYPQRSGGRC